MNKKLGMVCAVFAAVLAVLAFSSNTLYYSFLPSVTGAMPSMGTLTKSETQTGVAYYKETEEVFAGFGGTVEEVYVSEGEAIETGQALAKLSFSVEDLEKSLDGIEISRRKNRLETETLNLKLANLQNNINRLNSEVYEKDTDTNYTLLQLERDIAEAEENLAAQTVLYESGIISRAEYASAQNTLDDLLVEYENELEKAAKADDEEDESIQDKEEVREEQMEGWAYDRETIYQELKNNELELESLAIDEAYILAQLEDYEESVLLTAKFGGTLLEVNISVGAMVSAGLCTFEIGVGESFQVEVYVDAANNFIMKGDKASLSNVDNKLDGIVTRVTSEENGKRVTVEIESTNVTEGETFDVKFEKVSANKYTLVPNGAINYDSGGYFLYVIQERDGILGKEYYVSKQNVQIGDSDSSNTAITKGITFFEPIVELSDKALSEGLAVKLSNEGDFIVSDS